MGHRGCGHMGTAQSHRVLGVRGWGTQTLQVAQADKIMSLRMRKLMAQSQKAPLLPPSVTTSREPGRLGGVLLQQSRPPPGGDRPPVPCQRTRSHSYPRGPGQALALSLQCLCRTGPTRIQPPALWNLPVWSWPPWHPHGLEGGSPPGKSGAQGRAAAPMGERCPWTKTELNSEAAGNPGPP